MTTYVLGAGASVHAGYPLLGNLMSALKAWLTQSKSPIVSQIEWLCDRIAPHSNAAGGSINLEQALTELEQAPRDLVRLADETPAPQLRGKMARRPDGGLRPWMTRQLLDATQS